MTSLDYLTNEHWRWNGYRETVEFSVFANFKKVDCRVSRECIEDNLGNPQTPEACFDVAKASFDSITDKIGELIHTGRFEDDGSVLLRSSDW